MKRAVALALVGVWTACGGAQPAPAGASAQSGDPCADVELDVEKVWGASVRAEFLGKGGAIAGETRQSVATKLDALSRDWVMLRRSVCLDYFKRQVISKQQYSTRAACLDQNLQRQRSLIASLDAGGDVQLDSALRNASDEIGRCGNE
jgi:hypothetical protein